VKGSYTSIVRFDTDTGTGCTWLAIETPNQPMPSLSFAVSLQSAGDSGSILPDVPPTILIDSFFVWY